VFAAAVARAISHEELEAAVRRFKKAIWLALRNITAKWERTSHHWRAAMNQFAILYEDRFPPSPA
jgi:transposase-like protein